MPLEPRLIWNRRAGPVAVDCGASVRPKARTVCSLYFVISVHVHSILYSAPSTNTTKENSLLVTMLSAAQPSAALPQLSLTPAGGRRPPPARPATAPGYA